MRHLAGYDQRDAHEVLHAFLDNLGKSNQKYNEMIQLSLKSLQSEVEEGCTDKVKTKANNGKNAICLASVTCYKKYCFSDNSFAIISTLRYHQKIV